MGCLRYPQSALAIESEIERFLDGRFRGNQIDSKTIWQVKTCLLVGGRSVRSRSDGQSILRGGRNGLLDAKIVRVRIRVATVGKKQG